MATSNEPVVSDPANGDALRKGHSTRYWVLFVLVSLAAGILIFRYVWQPRQQETNEVAQETKAHIGCVKPIATVK